MAADDWLTPAEAARELRISLGTCYALIRDNRIPVIREGRQWRISRRVLDNAAARSQPQPTGISFLPRP
jgi:excisionase family DNA binding protein